MRTFPVYLVEWSLRTCVCRSASFSLSFCGVSCVLPEFAVFLGASVSPSSPDSPALSVSSFLASKLSGGGLKSVMVVAACALLFAGVHTVKNIAREVLSQAAEDLDARESEKLLNREDEEKLKRGE
ncbi:SNARE associated Golgi protein [Toxoplasma gondii RUB]|uniref:SNARE associated Golgi protein n=1 Tax=Toxoplasma gondii RUB TaxID=935652 RepID=A0A086M630_TOXGO|nr:SNARE associated Golgi protein [Toxoplasma gondii RUB]